MYGTIAQMKLKPNMLARMLDEFGGEVLQRVIPGLITTNIFQSDNDPNEAFLVTIFESREAYRANAESPEQHESFLKMMNYLAAEPEWHDGTVVWQQIP